MLIRLVFSVLFATSFLSADAQVRIRVFYGKDCESALIRVRDNQHQLLLNGREEVFSLEDGELILVSRAGDRIAVKRMEHSAFLADSIRIVCNSDTGFIDLSISDSPGVRAEYSGDFTFSSSLGTLKLINTINMDRYIAGVVQAEGGYKGHPEYFKSQAVIARTYAYLHLGKHSNEGYDLCDDVHCQAYHGRSVTETINITVSETRGQVLADGDSLLILAPFHSNCGGETVSSENVWLTSKPYLASVFDPYCAFSRNAAWEKAIKKDDWLRYMTEKGKMDINPDINMTFIQNRRMILYRAGGIEIPLTVIRSDWGFRSTFFSIRDAGDTLYFSGRGYGHGVGLCQEGAMVMAGRGFTYSQILDYYYNNVYLINIEDALIEDKGDLSF